MPIEHFPTKPEDNQEEGLPAERCAANDARHAMHAAKDESIDAVQAVRLPPFWRESPALWFAQAEAVFGLNRVSSDDAKFKYVIIHLDQTTLPLIADIATNPPTVGRYAAIKERLTTALGETSATKIRRLLGSHELGDEKPSLFLHRLRNLAAGQVNDEVLRTIFLEHLPENARSILAVSAVTDLANLAAQADKVMEVTRPMVAAIQTPAIQAPATGTTGAGSGPFELTELRREVHEMVKEMHAMAKELKEVKSKAEKPHRSRSRSRSFNRAHRGHARSRSKSEEGSGVCYYHRTFGDEAFKCLMPCEYKKKKPITEN